MEPVNIINFPDDEHVMGVCKPGQQETCRYLTIESSGWSCQKAGSLRRILDKRVADGEMRAQGDNCEGVLGVILANIDLLRGKRTLYEERMPIVQLSGTLEDIKLVGGSLLITARWGSDGAHNALSSSRDFLEIVITRDSIAFGLAGLGAFAVMITIFWD